MIMSKYKNYFKYNYINNKIQHKSRMDLHGVTDVISIHNDHGMLNPYIYPLKMGS